MGTVHIWTERGYLKKYFRFILTLLITSLLFQPNWVVRADVVSLKLTDFLVTTINEEVMEDGFVVNQYNDIRVSLDFKSIGQVFEGDYSTVDLPDDFRFSNIENFDVLDLSNNVIETATSSGKTVTLEYTEYADGKVIVGKLKFSFKIYTAFVTENRPVELTFYLQSEVGFGVELEFQHHSVYNR